ncbi:hypothetical protein [Methylobacter sp. BlB1]|jgi:hypothetical protein|uniref:hypothetical protein n=1 Tax=Methylobacter sp. BlB1 TaxID=2785914 RepID=UPI001895C910|nr:hypothetical protein [Methylobacter sp. BlB1]MBF6648953.1 hypothetical protein [Methylobacter sp. BlB1]
MINADFVQFKIEKINECNNAISTIARVLSELIKDDDCGNEITKDIKNNYIKGGLLDAIKVAADASDTAAGWIEREINKQGGDHDRSPD